MKSMNWLAMAALVAVAGIASAHPHAYVLGNDFVSLTEDVDSDGLPDVGGVRFAVGEPTPDASNIITLGVTDSNLGTAGGFYCQDWNDDSLCGDDGTVALVEPAAAFCNSVQFPAALPDYDAAKNALVFVDGPILGSPAFSECGLTVSWGIAGDGTHS